MKTPHEVALELLALEESRLAQVAGLAAKLAGGQEHGEVARHAAEYVVHRGEHFVRSKMAQYRAKRESKKLRPALAEKLNPVERESNSKLIHTDGPHYGPDPDVQREIKNHGYLARVAMAKLKRDKKVHESLPEYSGSPPGITGATQVKGYKNNPNRVKPKTGGRGDGFYRDGSEENSARVKTMDGSAM